MNHVFKRPCQVSSMDKLYMPQLGYILYGVMGASPDYKSIDQLTADVIKAAEIELSRHEIKNLTFRVRMQVNRLYRAKLMERKEVTIQNLTQYFYRRCLD